MASNHGLFAVLCCTAVCPPAFASLAPSEVSRSEATQGGPGSHPRGPSPDACCGGHGDTCSDEVGRADLEAACCLSEGGPCFDERCTRERCCGAAPALAVRAANRSAQMAARPAGDPAPGAHTPGVSVTGHDNGAVQAPLAAAEETVCWSGDMTFSGCCLRSDDMCFSSASGRERCCRQPALQFAGDCARWLRDEGLPAVAGRLRGSLLWVLAPAVCGALWGSWASCPAGPACAPGATIPAASLLRVMGTLGAMAWHHCWRPYLEENRLGTFRTWLLCLFNVQCDLFFVRAGYLAGSRPPPRRDALCSRAVCARAAAAGAALGVLRRAARTAPAAFVTPYAVSALASGTLAGPPLAEIAAHAAAQLVPHDWPLGVELVCFSAVQVLMVLTEVAGEAAGLSSTAALLAACLQWRARSGPLPLRRWHQGYRSIPSHRLPTSLATLLATRLLRLAWPEPPGGSPEPGARGGAALGALLWGAAGLGMLFAATCEWLVQSGIHFLLMPWWFYPFLAKVPLVLGCVLILERSRRTAGRPDGAPPRGKPARTAAVAWLERLSWPAMCCHNDLRAYMRRELLPVRYDLEILLFTLFGLVSWSYAVGALVLWVGAPYERFLQRSLLALQPPAAAAGWWAWAVSAGLVLSAVSVTAWAARATCTLSDASLSPCVW
uniref:Uncharacterized protein n=1 Tax=Alexandrium monilatum TaxID=311494 RepID=A0A7S4VB11_9DINO